jgi:hypothetical protein
MGASHYRTGWSRKNEAAFDPPIDASGLDRGLVPRWSPFRGRTLFARALLAKGASSMSRKNELRKN